MNFNFEFFEAGFSLALFSIDEVNDLTFTILLYFHDKYDFFSSLDFFKFLVFFMIKLQDFTIKEA